MLEQNLSWYITNSQCDQPSVDFTRITTLYVSVAVGEGEPSTYKGNLHVPKKNYKILEYNLKLSYLKIL